MDKRKKNEQMNEGTGVDVRADTKRNGSKKELKRSTHDSNDINQTNTLQSKDTNHEGCNIEDTPVNVLVNPLEDVGDKEKDESGMKEHSKEVLKDEKRVTNAAQKNNYVCINLMQFNEDKFKNSNAKMTISQESVNVLKPLFYVGKRSLDEIDRSQNNLNTTFNEIGVAMRLNDISAMSEKNLLSVKLSTSGRLNTFNKNNQNSQIPIRTHSNSRLTAVARDFFQRRRSHQDCLISTVNEVEEINIDDINLENNLKQNRDKSVTKRGEKKKKGGGIEAMLRQSCVDVRNLIVGNGPGPGPSPGLTTPMGLFNKGRRQSTMGLFQPGPRISPLPFEQANGLPGSALMRFCIYIVFL